MIFGFVLVGNMLIIFAAGQAGELIAWGMSLQRVTNRIEVGRKSMRLKLHTKISLDTDRQGQSRLTSCLLTFDIHFQERERGHKGRGRKHRRRMASGLHVEQKQSNRNLVAHGKAIYRRPS